MHGTKATPALHVWSVSAQGLVSKLPEANWNPRGFCSECKQSHGVSFTFASVLWELKKDELSSIPHLKNTLTLVYLTNERMWCSAVGWSPPIVMVHQTGIASAILDANFVAFEKLMLIGRVCYASPDRETLIDISRNNDLPQLKCKKVTLGLCRNSVA